MISEGPLGPSLLVKEKATGEKCVVKQVECTDYTQAMLAYNQVRKRLLVKAHLYISSLMVCPGSPAAEAGVP